MKELKIAIIVLLLAAAVCICVLLGITLYDRDRTYGEGGKNSDGAYGEGKWNYDMVQEWELPAEEIQSLQVEMSFQDVIFCQGSEDTVVIREYMNFEPEDSQRSKVSQEGGRLLVKGGKFSSFHFFFNFSFFNSGSRNGYLEIYLPDSLGGGLDTVRVQTSSGDIRSELPLTGRQDFSLSTTSGDIALNQIAGSGTVSSTSGNIVLDRSDGKLECSSTSGDVSLGQAEGELSVSSTSGNVLLDWAKGDVRCSSTSGDVSLGELQGSSEITTTSGEVRVERLEGGFRIETTSGDISVLDGKAGGSANAISGEVSVSLEQLTGELVVSTTSGDVDLRLPEGGSYGLDFTSSSGECNTFFDDALSFDKKGHKARGQYGGGANAIEVSTTSGDLRVGAR